MRIYTKTPEGLTGEVGRLLDDMNSVVEDFDEDVQSKADTNNPLQHLICRTLSGESVSARDLNIIRSDGKNIIQFAEEQHPDEVWIGDDDISNPIHVVIKGHVYVSGSTISVNTQHLNIEDNKIILNYPYSGDVPVENAHIMVDRGISYTMADIKWNELEQQWEAGLSGSTSPIIVASDVINAIDMSDTDKPLSANMGKQLKDELDIETNNKIEVIIDGNGFAITTGYKGIVSVPKNCTIVRATILSDQSTSTVLDIWKCTYAEYDGGATHPVNGDSITATAPLTISSATKEDDSTLTGWTTSLSKGDILGFNIDSNNNSQILNICLYTEPIS